MLMMMTAHLMMVMMPLMMARTTPAPATTTTRRTTTTTATRTRTRASWTRTTTTTATRPRTTRTRTRTRAWTRTRTRTRTTFTMVSMMPVLLMLMRLYMLMAMLTMMHLQTRNMRPTLALPVRGVQHMRIDLQLAANPPGKKLGFVGCRPLAVDGASGTMAAADASHGPGAPAPPRSVLRSDRTPDLHRQTQRHPCNIETGGHGGSWSVHHAQGPHIQNPSFFPGGMYAIRHVCHAHRSRARVQRARAAGCRRVRPIAGRKHRRWGGTGPVSSSRNRSCFQARIKVFQEGCTPSQEESFRSPEPWPPACSSSSPPSPPPSLSSTAGASSSPSVHTPSALSSPSRASHQEHTHDGHHQHDHDPPRRRRGRRHRRHR